MTREAHCLMDVDLPRLTAGGEVSDAGAGTFELAADDLGYAYAGGPAVLDGVSLTVRPGEVVALLGANGGGKSTLLKVLLGLLRPRRGAVRLDGRPLARWNRRQVARRLAYVPQSQALPFPYPVRDLVALGRLPHAGLIQRLGPRDHAAVDAALARLNIGHLAWRPYTELSGGQRQLCLIARALAQEAPLIVMDEPVGGLDYGNQWRLLALVRALAAEGRSILLSSHHPDHALGVATRAVLLHQGRVLADGCPDAVVTPEHVWRLYGLAVARHRLPDGRVTLLPSDAPV